MNHCVIIGRLTKDPALKYTQSGTAVATFNLAVDRRVSKDKEKEADFIPVVVWGKSAESTSQYTGKGKLIAIAGKIQTRSYDHKDGYKVYVTEVVAEDVQFLEWGNSSKQENNDDFQPLDADDSSEIPF